MLENLFITYANNSFREDPENILKFFDEVLPFVETASKSWLQNTKEALFHVAKMEHYGDAVNYVADNHAGDASDASMYVMSIVSTVLGGRGGYCKDAWNEGPNDTFSNCEKSRGFNLREILDKAGLKELTKLKCHECRQIHFINILNDIASGRSFGDTLETEGYLDNADNFIGEKLLITDNDEIARHRFINLPSDPNDVPCDNPLDAPESFHALIAGLVGYSLSEFLLLPNDRRKLKRCPYCEQFFPAKNIRRTRCYSEECERAYQREKKRKQRDSDPAKYY